MWRKYNEKLFQYFQSSFHLFFFFFPLYPWFINWLFEISKRNDYHDVARSVLAFLFVESAHAVMQFCRLSVWCSRLSNFITRRRNWGFLSDNLETWRFKRGNTIVLRCERMCVYVCTSKLNLMFKLVTVKKQTVNASRSPRSSERAAWPNR